MQARDVMSEVLFSVASGATVYEAGQAAGNSRVSALPVVDENGVRPSHPLFTRKAVAYRIHPPPTGNADCGEEEHKSNEAGCPCRLEAFFSIDKPVHPHDVDLTNSLGANR